MESAILKALDARLRTQSLYSIAYATGIPLSTLSRWRRGEGSLRLSTADRLASYLGLTLTESTELQPGELAPWDMLPTD